jgi:Xaa-Pro aminopeptidase
VTEILPPLPNLATLPPMPLAGRVERLQASLDEAGVDVLVVTRPVNIRYLTAFSGSAGVLVVRPDELILVTDGRYRDQAAEQLAAAPVAARIEIAGTNQQQVVQAAVARCTRIGLEAEHVTWAQQRRFAQEWFTDAELVATTGLVETLRLTKDDGELARIEAAGVITDHALATVRPMLAERPTERELALALDTEIRRLGATGTSFETIVGSGPNGAKPHARPGDRLIVEGDLVVLDLGAVVDGYCSDMTRTIMIGEPTVTQQRMFDVVLAAQQAGVDAVREGVAVAEIDATCRSVIAEAGWAEAFVHATGHGVGLDIHEQPRVAASGDATLAAGQVVTVEPGVYLPEHGGVRIEDTVVVTADGCRVLTHTAKAPSVA